MSTEAPLDSEVPCPRRPLEPFGHCGRLGCPYKHRGPLKGERAEAESRRLRRAAQQPHPIRCAACDQPGRGWPHAERCIHNPKGVSLKKWASGR